MTSSIKSWINCSTPWSQDPNINHPYRIIDKPRRLNQRRFSELLVHMMRESKIHCQSVYFNAKNQETFADTRSDSSNTHATFFGADNRRTRSKDMSLQASSLFSRMQGIPKSSTILAPMNAGFQNHSKIISGEDFNRSKTPDV